MIPEFEKTSQSVFEQNFKYKLRELDLSQFSVYEKPVLCSFELDFLLKNRKGELIDVEIEGIQYVFTSGRLIREREIRD